MKRIVIFTVLAVAAVLAACSNKGVEGTLKANQPPTVWLSAGPPEGSTGKYRIQMFWGGWDPDGEIAGYEYLVSDNEGTFNPADTVGVPWRPVAGNDSSFTFSADEPVDTLHADNTKQVDVFTRSHTFFIRAVDREGLRSKVPAYRSFTSRTLSPEVHIERPQVFALNPAAVPQISTYRWKALDWVDDLLLSQDPDSVQYALIPVPAADGSNYTPTIQALQRGEKEQYFRPWVWYKAPQDSGKFWTTPVIDPGKYVFAIRAKDEAGAITPVFNPDDANSGTRGNVRRVSVGPLTSGPTMTVQNDYVGIIRTTSCNTPTSILDSPAGVPLSFKIQATADSYGGTIAGYRYGWDIPDLNDPEQWEIDVTPFLSTAVVPPRTFFFGTHTLTMEVVDNSGYCSRVEVKVNIIQFTLDRNLLVVDDDSSDEVVGAGWSGVGSGPNDQEHDQFWIDAAAEVSGFDEVIDMIDTKQRFIPLATLAQYKSIIWDVYGANSNASAAKQPLIYDYISHRPKNPTTAPAGKLQPNVLALTMAAGGHIMLCGRQPVQEVCSRVYTKGARFPLIFLYELEGAQASPPSGDALTSPIGDLSFAYRELCLETIDFALQTTSLRRASKQYCRIDAIRPHGGAATAPREDTMREAFSLDPNFPTLTLRPEAAGPGQWYEPSQFGLDAEVYNPTYFKQLCQSVPRNTRSCFQPIYGLECFDTLEPTYHQPIAFWTSAFADRVAEVPGAVAARSIVFGFSPVYIKPAEMQQALDYVFFKEWKLPRRTIVRAAGSP